MKQPNELWELTKEFRFEAAHRLAKGYVGKCSNIHGHSWNGEICLTVNRLDALDMGVDFTDMKDCVKNIEDMYDHKLILYKGDEVLKEFCESQGYAIEVCDDNPTCETLAHDIYWFVHGYFTKNYPGIDIRVKYVKIKETCTTSCTYTAPGSNLGASIH